ncbi:MAG: hypothetical protein DHS20C18_05090 [Saprospiraceae bacterium]|nr:MAG: hypothetical protein DHS20C18_05090 [Saprospiraceae bacterium]
MEELVYYIPEELLPFKEQLLATKQPFIEIIPAETAPEHPWQSKFGGNPYLPKGTEFPRDPEGRHLFFLAQINFEEVPEFAPFPAKGMLQFYIADDELFGQNPDQPKEQHRFRVLYFPETITDTSQLQSDFSFLPEYGELPVYPGQSYGMIFEMSREIVPFTDYQFAHHFSEDFFAQFGEKQWEVLGLYQEEVSSEGHKIGGYAHFAQEDFRSPENPLVLLFQMDTDVEMESMWGDMGTANFFIDEADLKQLDFSKVLYHWDSH